MSKLKNKKKARAKQRAYNEQQAIAAIADAWPDLLMNKALKRLNAMNAQYGGFRAPSALATLPAPVRQAWLDTPIGRRQVEIWEKEAQLKVQQQQAQQEAHRQRLEREAVNRERNQVNQWKALWKQHVATLMETLRPNVVLLKTISPQGRQAPEPCGDAQTSALAYVESEIVRAETWWARWQEQCPEPPDAEAVWTRMTFELDVGRTLPRTRAQKILAGRWGLGAGEWGERLKVAKKVRDELAKIEREEAAVERAYSKTLLHGTAAAALLGVTRYTWNKHWASKIEVVEEREFSKWGQILTACYYDPDDVAALAAACKALTPAAPRRPTSYGAPRHREAGWMDAVEARWRATQGEPLSPEGALILTERWTGDCPGWGHIETKVGIDWKAARLSPRIPDDAEEAVTTLRAGLDDAAARWLQWLTQSLNQAAGAWPTSLRNTLWNRLVTRLAVSTTAQTSWPASANVWTPMLSQAMTGLLKGGGEDTQLVRREAGLSDIPGWYPAARALERRWTVWLGPTNSGKTHGALERLTAAANGIYLAPLRLMALEAFDRLTAQGLACALRTGEEHREPASGEATHVAATIEAGLFDHTWDVAVIDEAQMLGDPERGWAWTQALVGVAARDVCVCAAPEAREALQALADRLGEPIEFIACERATPLRALDGPVPLTKVRSGDAVVAFSRQQVLGYRAWLRTKGHSVASIYGNLGPEVRRAEAERFRSGEATVLVATDAIGMGLNLPIRRVLFAADRKYDGTCERPLTDGEWRQIGGRAGRRGFHECGEVGVLDGSSPKALAQALNSPPQALASVYSIRPPWTAVEKMSTWFGLKGLADALRAVDDLVGMRSSWSTRALRAHGAEPWVAWLSQSTLPLRMQFDYWGCPLHRSLVDIVGQWALTHARGQRVTLASSLMDDDSERYAPDDDLIELENTCQRLTAYRWLALRFPLVYPDGTAATADLNWHQDLIAQRLATAALERLCRSCGKRLSVQHRFPECEACYRERQERRSSWGEDEHWR